MNYGEEIVFTGGINSDDEARAIPKGDYRDFQYCRLGEVSGKGFCVVTSQGTKEVFNETLTENYKILGGATWEKQNAIVYFVYRNIGADQIWMYDIATESHTLIIESTILDLSPDYPIYHANIIDDILKWTDGKWNDSVYMYSDLTGNRAFNPPYQINIQKALDGFYAGIENELRTFDAVKWPFDPPVCAYGTDAERVDNKLRRKLFKFMVQPIYENGETGVWSMYSNLPIPTVNELVTGTNWLDPKTDNVIYVRFNTGPKNVRKINVAVQQFDETSYGAEPNFGTFLQLNKDVDSIADNVEYVVSFYGDAALSQIADLFKNYDRLPIEANCQDFLPTNELAYVNFREGFDKDVIIDASASYTKTYIDYSPTASDIFIGVNPASNSIELPAKFQKIYITTETFRTETNSTSFSPGDTYTSTLFACELDGTTYDPPLEFNVQYTITQADYSNALAVGTQWDAEKYLLDKIVSQWCLQMEEQEPLPSLGLTVDYSEQTITPAGPSSLLIGGKYFEVEIKNGASNGGAFSERTLCGLGTAYFSNLPDPLIDEPIPYNNPPITSLRPNGVVTSLKKGARHQFGIVYGDRAYRDGTVYTSQDMETFVKWPSDEDRDMDAQGNVTNERPYYVKPVIQINHQPPVWATKYWIVARQNTQIGDFGQFALTYNEDGSSAITTESDGKYRVYLDNYYENNNLGATINYQIQRGDVVRFLWQTPKGIYYGMDMTDNVEGDILYYTDYIELEVLDYDPGEAGGRQSIYVSRMNKNLISRNNKFYSILVEIYRPQPAVIDNDVFVSPWRDITRSFNILNPHKFNRTHDVESVALTFAVYNFSSGTRDYIDVVGNIPLESGTTIKINNWTGSAAGNDIYAVVSSYVYPSSVSGIQTTKYILENIYYENTGSTLDYLTAPYNPNSFQVTYYSGSASIYGIPQEYGGNPAQVYPQYGDVFMRQRIYGTGVNENSLQIEEGAEPALYVTGNANYLSAMWPPPGADYTNILFPNISNVYPSDSWLTETDSNGQTYNYYLVQFPGDYTFDWGFYIKRLSSNAGGSGVITLVVAGSTTQFITLDTITGLTTSFVQYTGTTSPITLNTNDKVSVIITRTDLLATPIVRAVAGNPSSTTPQILIGGNWTDYSTSTYDGIAGLVSTSGAISGFTPSSTVVGSTVYAIEPIVITIASVANYVFLVGGNWNLTNKYLTMLNENGTTTAGFTNLFNTSSGVTVKAIEAGKIASGSNQFIYVGGNFNLAGNNDINLIKLNLNGTQVAAFTTGAGPNGEVLAIKHHDNANETIQKEILVGGSFTQYNGTPSSKLVVLKDNRTTTSENGTIQVNEYACVPSDLGFNGDVYAIEQTATNASSTNQDFFLIGGNFTTYTTKRVIGFRAASVNLSMDDFASYTLTGFSQNDQAIVTPIQDPNSYNFQDPPFTNNKLYDTSGDFYSGHWANEYITGNVSFTIKCSWSQTLVAELGIQLWYSNNNFATESMVWEKRLSYPSSAGAIDETFLLSIGAGAFYRVKVFQKAYNSNATSNFTNITWYLNTPSTMPSTQTVTETISTGRILSALMYNEYYGRVLTPIPFSGAGASGPVRAIQRINNTTALIGGNFTTYNGGNYKYVVAINTSNGTVISGWTDPDLNGEVFSITQGYTPTGTATYISGDFTFAGSGFYGGVLKIDPITGVVDGTFTPGNSGPNLIQYGIGDDAYLEISDVDYNANNVGPAPTTMYWYIEDRHYSDFWKSDVHNVGRYRLEDPNVKTVHRKASAIHSDSLIFGTQVNGLSSFGLDNQNIVDLNPIHGEIVRAITSGREGKTLKCIQPNKENSIYIQFYPNEVGDTSNLRVSDKTFSTWFDYKSLFGTTEPGGVALLPDGTTIYFDPTRGAFVYSDSNGQRVISETSLDSQVDYKFRTKTKELTKRFKEQYGQVRTYVNEKMGEVGFAFRFDTGTIEEPIYEYVHVVWDYIRERWRSTYDYNAEGYLNFGQTLIGWNSDNEIYLHNDPDSINFHGNTSWTQRIVFVANDQPTVVKRFQNIIIRSDKAFDVTAVSTSNYNYGVMETSMPSSMFVFYEGYGKSYYRKNKNTPGYATTAAALINGEDMRADAMTHTFEFSPTSQDKSRTLFNVGIRGILS